MRASNLPPGLPKIFVEMEQVPLAIGHLLREWSGMEHHGLVWVISRIINVPDDVARFIIFSVNGAQQTDLLMGLTKLSDLPQETKDRIFALEPEIIRLRTERNAVVHGDFSSSNGENLWLRTTKARGKKYNRTMETMTSEHIFEVVRDVQALHGKLLEIHREFKKTRPWVGDNAPVVSAGDAAPLKE